MKILAPTLSQLARLRSWQIQEWIEEPILAQTETLKYLLAHGQYTEFGKKYNFEKINQYEEFKNIVPLHHYDDIKPYIFRAQKGEECLLWDMPTTWFAKSSGTTSDKSKFIPITEDNLQDCHYQAAKDVITLYYQSNPNSQLLTGKSLIIGGSHQVHPLNEQTFYGDLSAVLLQNAPLWGQWIKAPNLEIALIEDWNLKLEQIVETTINENITSISGVPTWTYILIKKILEKTGKKKLKEVWPNLELYLHGGVSFVPYRAEMQSIIGGTEPIKCLEIYNASEGFFAAQLFPEDPEGLLLFANHGIFYEFLPMKTFNDPNSCKTLSQVTINENYALVISTNSGLWRYIVGDTIQFTALHPYKIKITGRINHFLNTFGEEVMIEQTDRALSQTCTATNSTIIDYTVAPVFMGNVQNGKHEWYIEFTTPPENIVDFAKKLDDELKKINSDYEAKRFNNLILSLPDIKQVPVGTFNRWLSKNNKIGGQHKIPRLSNNRFFLDALDNLLGCAQ
ncbi:MAG: GH3 auxin-responsive promoter family protein [Phycisphaerales bacterium]|nr:GH3 auxin-responsive promoter family protein [Phycisphaerales bacterium]